MFPKAPAQGTDSERGRGNIWKEHSGSPMSRAGSWDVLMWVFFGGGVGRRGLESHVISNEPPSALAPTQTAERNGKAEL